MSNSSTYRVQAGYRSRKHGLLLYPDDKSHVEALEIIKLTYEYLAILHDKDKDDSGKPKKAHWHVVLSTRNATWNTSIAKELAITVNYIQKIRNEESAVCYLIHWNEETKHQYELEECFGTNKLKNLLLKVTQEEQKTESEKVLELIEWITNADRYMSITDFARVCAATDRWDIFRRSASIFLKILDETNNKSK